jgi:uncharacterized integral membrane protein (TIGR00697 family)
MPNELLWFLFLIFNFAVSLAVYRAFGKTGLFVLIVLNITICNIQVLKLVELFGVTTTLGNILYGSIFFATDLLGEVHGKREARRGVIIGFIALVFLTVAMQTALLFKPAPDDFAQPAMLTLFAILPRIALASALAYILSQIHDVWAFHHIRRRTQGRHLWLRNNLSTLVSQAIDTTIFVGVAFLGVFDFPVVVSIWWTTYLIKVLVAASDTPFLYLGRKVATARAESAASTADN